MSKEIALTLDSRKRLGSTYLKLTKPKVRANVSHRHCRYELGSGH